MMLEIEVVECADVAAGMEIYEVQKPFVSVIVATRNEENFIRRLLDSLANQSYPLDRFEIIIVDGLSNDTTLQIVETFKNRLNVRVFSNPKIRSTFAFNTGIDEAKGNLFMIVNAHSFLRADFMEEDVNTFIQIRKFEPKLAGVGGIYINESDNTLGRAIGLLYSTPFSGASSCRYKKEPHFSDSVIFGVFDKKIVIDNGKFDEDFFSAGNDNELAKRLRRKGYKLFTNPNIVAHYYARNSLRKFLKQTYNYGVAQGIIVRKGNYTPKLRSTASLWFVPMSLVLYEIFVLALFLFSGVSFLLAFVPLVAYWIVNGFASLSLFNKTKNTLCLILPPLFFLFHNTLGLSSLLGLIFKKKVFI